MIVRLDSSTDADLQHRELLRRMSFQQKWELADTLYQTAWALKTAGVRSQHPDWTEERVHAAVRDIFLYART